MGPYAPESTVYEEVALSIHEEMPSGPVAVFNGSLEMRHRMLSLVQRSSSGRGKRDLTKDQKLEGAA